MSMPDQTVLAARCSFIMKKVQLRLTVAAWLINSTQPQGPGEEELLTQAFYAATDAFFELPAEVRHAVGNTALGEVMFLVGIGAMRDLKWGRPSSRQTARPEDQDLLIVQENVLLGMVKVRLAIVVHKFVHAGYFKGLPFAPLFEISFEAARAAYDDLPAPVALHVSNRRLGEILFIVGWSAMFDAVEAWPGPDGAPDLTRVR
jgi:hypothetical protein